MTITLKKILVAVAILGVLGGIGQAMTGANQAPDAQPANVSATVKDKMYRDCAARGLVQHPRGSRTGTVMNYVGDNGQINVHLQIVDSLGNELTVTRCVYSPDGGMFIRGAK